MKKHAPHPTLTDVARKAGVGTTTVSRVINGGERVSPETLARVQAVIHQLGYVPNQAARILKGERTRTVGLVIPSIADSFFASCAETAQEIARVHDSLLVVTTTSNDPYIEMESLRVLTLHRTDGLLIAPADSNNPALATFLQNSKVPAVCIDRPAAKSGVASVVIDNLRGARLATEHLIAHGYRRILCLGGETSLWTIQERLRGYRGAISAAGLVPMEDMSVTNYRSAESAIRRYVVASRLPDAIFSLKNSTTIYTFEALQKLGIDIPGKIALLGFDDFELAATLGISVVQQPIEELGRTAAELLFHQLLKDRRDKQPEPASRLIKLMPELVPRTSCGCKTPRNS